MTTSFPSFFGKLLLFGEYGIILGSMALTVPFRKYSGRLKFPEPGDRDAGFQLESNKNLKEFYAYLLSHKELNQSVAMDYAKLSSDLKDGIFFDSDIPMGYGAGSSGALVTALYSEYCSNILAPSEEKNIPVLKKLFSLMESYFHGTSSGMDPLSCFTDAPLLVENIEKIRQVSIPPQGREVSFFLIDTGMTGPTGPLVKGFMDQLKTEAYSRQIRKKYIPLTRQCIESLLDGDSEAMTAHFKDLSRFQMDHFRNMIPVDFHKVWEKGLSSKSYALKLCGSGGGGFLLGITEERGLPEEVNPTLQGRIQYPAIV